MSLKKHRSYYLYLLVLVIVIVLIVFSIKKNTGLNLTGYVSIKLEEKDLDDYFESIYESNVTLLIDGWKLDLDTYLDDTYIEYRNNNIYYVTADAKEELNIGSISKAYYISTNYPKIYMINDNGNVYSFEIPALILDHNKGINDIIESYKASYKYSDIVDVLSVKGKGEESLYDVILLSEDIKYSLTDDREFNYKYKINYSVLEESENGTNFVIKKTAYIKEDRSVEINNKIIDKKFKLSFADSYDDEPGYFVTMDNYLYSVEEEKVVGDSKIKSINFKPDGYDSIYGNYVVIFKDGNYVTFDGSYSEIDF